MGECHMIYCLLSMQQNNWETVSKGLLLWFSQKEDLRLNSGIFCLCKHVDTSDFHEHKGTEKEPRNLFFFPCKFLVSP